MPKLVNARVPFLDPSFEALVKSQIKFAEDAHAKMAELKKYFSKHGIDENMDGRVDETLQKLRDLSISQAFHSAH